jgi:hypothetical protein
VQLEKRERLFRGKEEPTGGTKLGSPSSENVQPGGTTLSTTSVY